LEVASPVQLHLKLPFKKQPGEHPRVRDLLQKGYRIVQLQRITDQEVVITLTLGPASPSPAG